MTTEIKHRATNEVLYTHDGDSLAGADLHGTNLRNANLRNADLSGANLRGADLGGADLSGARVSTRTDWLTLFGMVVDAEATAKETE